MSQACVVGVVLRTAMFAADSEATDLECIIRRNQTNRREPFFEEIPRC
jgi:hypothetical protein